MSLSNAIAIIRRQDAQVKVEVPATANRKAYSYMREGSDNPQATKSSARKRGIGGVIAAGIGGAIVGGALTAGVLAMRRAKKNGEDEPKKIAGDDAIDAESRVVSNAVEGSSIKGEIAQGQPKPNQRKKPLVTPPPSTPDRVIVTPEPKSIKTMVKEGADTRSPSKQNARLGTPESVESTSAITNKKKGVIDRGIEAVKKMTKEGVERDRKAGGAFAEREIDLNKTAYSAGEKSRIAAQNLATFTKAYNETFGKNKPQTIDVKATEVSEALPESKPVKTESKTKKGKTAAKAPKKKSPTAAEKRAIQKQLDDLNKGV